MNQVLSVLGQFAGVPSLLTSTIGCETPELLPTLYAVLWDHIWSFCASPETRYDAEYKTVKHVK